MKYKSMIWIIILTLITTSLMSSYAKTDDVKVYYNGSEIDFDTAPVIQNGRTMVPLRAIFEAFDMEVNWDGETHKVTAYKEGLNIELIIGSNQPTVNGVVTPIDTAAFISDGRTMVPLRFIAESTGADVLWDSDLWSVSIKDSNLLSYKIVDTGTDILFTDKSEVTTLSVSSPFYGQDGQYDGYQPNYEDHGDGTITDEVTGLMWQQTMDEKMTFEDAIEYADESSLGGYSDWRVPTIKELFSLIMFDGSSGGEVAKDLYINTDYFNQPIGDTSIGEREIDAQVWSSTKYVSTTMNNDPTIFGVNFIDGRIKGYGLIKPQTKADNKGYFRLVRGNTSYGENTFVDNGDGTISDLSTGLMWQLSDDGVTRDWEEALVYSEALNLADYSNWRLPNIKELQSIVDYTKSPATTNSPAIDDLFILSEIIDPNGDVNYGYYWSSTTHQDGMNTADSASYVAFGEAQGEMFGKVMDVHGAGSVRSDPKSGDEDSYPTYFGPQGDVRYTYNYVLAVRTIE